SVPCQGALRDLAFVELLASSPGEEMVWLEKYTLYVKSADGEQVLEKLSAHPTDAIAVMRHLDVASGDLLVRSYVEGGVQKINVRNETLSSPGYALGARDCTAILPRQGDTYGDHLLLTRGGVGDVDLLELHISTGPGGLILERSTTGDWIDTHEDSEQRPIQAASLVDLDLDGQEDLMVAVLNGHSLELRNVMTSDLDAQRWRNLDVDEPNLESLGNGNFEVSVTMQVPEVLASTTVQVDMWARRDPGTVDETIHFIGRQWVTISVGQTEHEFNQAFDGAGWDPANSHYEMSFVSVELDTSGVVTRLFPSQGLAWAPPGAQSAMLQLGLTWLNFAVNQSRPQRHRARRVSSPRLRPVPERVVQ
ncbi:MAG: hypothetical protein JKY61_03090, partial [Planctomycetes bacterium]|nr:hypothetical protein [Planctomycetota bacterium]